MQQAHGLEPLILQILLVEQLLGLYLTQLLLLR